jgi:hypothetical protein
VTGGCPNRAEEFANAGWPGTHHHERAGMTPPPLFLGLVAVPLAANGRIFALWAGAMRGSLPFVETGP